MGAFDIQALEWFVDKHLRACLESPDMVEAELLQSGWPENLVLYGRALMSEMAGKAKAGFVWRPGKHSKGVDIKPELIETEGEQDPDDPETNTEVVE